MSNPNIIKTAQDVLNNLEHLDEGLNKLIEWSNANSRFEKNLNLPESYYFMDFMKKPTVFTIDDDIVIDFQNKWIYIYTTSKSTTTGYIEKESTYKGFIKTNKKCTIKNLNVYIYGEIAAGGGGIICDNSTNFTIENCNVIIEGINVYNIIRCSIGAGGGGIVGANACGNIYNCYSHIKIEGDEETTMCIIGEGAGGIIGMNAGYTETSQKIPCYITNCVSECTNVKNQYTKNNEFMLREGAGGIVGKNAGNNSFCYITNCSTFVHISGFWAGGITGKDAGINGKCYVTNCSTFGNISGGGAGGITGYNDADCTCYITNCSTFGKITNNAQGTGSGCIIVDNGSRNNQFKITNCFGYYTDAQLKEHLDSKVINKFKYDNKEQSTINYLTEQLETVQKNATIPEYIQSLNIDANVKKFMQIGWKNYKLNTNNSSEIKIILRNAANILAADKIDEAIKKLEVLNQTAIDTTNKIVGKYSKKINDAELYKEVLVNRLIDNNTVVDADKKLSDAEATITQNLINTITNIVGKYYTKIDDTQRHKHVLYFGFIEDYNNKLVNAAKILSDDNIVDANTARENQKLVDDANAMADGELKKLSDTNAKADANASQSIYDDALNEAILRIATAEAEAAKRIAEREAEAAKRIAAAEAEAAQRIAAQKIVTTFQKIATKALAVEKKSIQSETTLTTQKEADDTIYDNFKKAIDEYVAAAKNVVNVKAAAFAAKTAKTAAAAAAKIAAAAAKTAAAAAKTAAAAAKTAAAKTAAAKTDTKSTQISANNAALIATEAEGKVKTTADAVKTTADEVKVAEAKVKTTAAKVKTEAVNAAEAKLKAAYAKLKAEAEAKLKAADAKLKAEEEEEENAEKQ